MSETELNSSGSSSVEEKKSSRWLLSLLIIGLAIVAVMGGSRWILSMKPVAKKKEFRKHVVWVEVEKVSLKTHQIPVSGMGEIKPYRRLGVMAEVSGRVVSVPNGIEAGAKVKKGQVLCLIDPIPYESTLSLRKSEVAQRELALLEEQARVAQAKREIERIGMEGAEPLQRKLRSRLPHLAAAKEALEAAKAQVTLAERNLKRCSVTAPFDGILTAWMGHLGSQVTPQSQLGILLDDTRFDLEFQLRRDQLTLLPNRGAEVVLNLPGGERKGKWDYLMPEHHGKGRLVTLKVSVDQPMKQDQTPVFVDSFVTAHIKSHPFEKSLILPRDMVDENGHVWLCVSGNTLKKTSIEFIPINTEEVLVTSGLEDGDVWVKSRLSAAVEGMIVSPLSSEDD